jgi:hypothetical protein
MQQTTKNAFLKRKKEKTTIKAKTGQEVGS